MSRVTLEKYWDQNCLPISSFISMFVALAIRKELEQIRVKLVIVNKPV